MCVLAYQVLATQVRKTFAQLRPKAAQAKTPEKADKADAKNNSPTIAPAAAPVVAAPIPGFNPSTQALLARYLATPPAAPSKL